MKNKILLIDGTYLAYKSYYATSYGNNTPHLQNSKGFSTNAIVGFFNTFLSLIKYQKPTHVFFAFDSREKTFRHQLFNDYKGNRAKAPVDFHEQLNKIQDILTLSNFKNEYVNGFEADDIIAKMASTFKDDEQNEIIIYSADQDLNQLISTNVSIFKKYKTENILLTLNNFTDYYDFLPSQVIDYKAIVGDNSDNFKGIVGLGPKTAATLLNKYGSLENIYNNLDNLKPKQKEKFIEHKNDALRDKYLATLRTDFETKTTNLDELKLTNMSLRGEIFNLLDELELNNLKKKLLDLETY